MKTEYKRDLKNNYLVIEADTGLDMDDYIVHMTEENTIPGILPMQIRKTDGKCCIYYEITSRQSMENRYEKKQLDCSDILHILSEMQEVLESVRKYLLNPRQIIFDPRYMYMTADDKIAFCYLPVSAPEFSVSALSEFILKRLNHKDAEAVALGYSFYQYSAEENFSLSSILQKVLTKSLMQNCENRGKNQTDREKVQEDGIPQNYADRAGSVQEKRYQESERNSFTEDEFQVCHWERKRKNSKNECYEKELITERQENRGAKKKLTDRLFAAVHPAVLIAALLLLVMLEVILYLGYLELTEAGGLMFLILSAAILINKFWKARREKRKRTGIQKERDDEYREELEEHLNIQKDLLQKEMYQREIRTNPIMEETQCLSEDQMNYSGMSLISKWPEKYPAIHIRNGITIVGKSEEQADVLIREAAVSRIHARLEQRQGVFYIRDLNSRNGTYINGIRLKPQEQKEIRGGDRISFANISFEAVEEKDDL